MGWLCITLVTQTWTHPAKITLHVSPPILYGIQVSWPAAWELSYAHQVASVTTSSHLKVTHKCPFAHQQKHFGEWCLVSVQLTGKTRPITSLRPAYNCNSITAKPNITAMAYLK